MKTKAFGKSIRLQLVVSFLLLTIILSLVVVVSSWAINRQSMQRRLRETYSLTLDYISAGINDKLQDISNVSDYIFTNETIKKAITLTDTTALDARQIMQAAQEELTSYTLPEFYENINRITIIGNNGNTLRAVLNYADYAEDGLRDLYPQWAEDPAISTGHAVWSGIISRHLNPHLENSPLVKETVLYRVIKNLKYTSNIGTMYITVNDRLFRSEIQNYYSNYPDFSQCSIIVSDHNGCVIDSADCPLSEDEIISLISEDNPDRSNGIPFPKADQTIFVKTISDGWFLIGLLPETVTLSDDRYVQKMAFIVFPLCIITCCLIWLYLSSGIFRPLQKISSSMKRIASGETDLRISQLPDNEVGSLGTGLNEMLEKLDILSEENRQKEIRILDAQYREKLAQINPHFIYNTLNSIRWMAVIAKADNIKQALDALWAIEKYQTNSSNEIFSTVSEEIDIVEKYIYLQKLSYGSEFEVMWDLGEDLQDDMCIRFFLQPLVENAIKHGALPKSGICAIGISIFHEDDMLVFNIYDDGAGIDSDTLQQLQDGFSRPDGHIGLLNIFERLQYAYGNDFQFDISSKEGVFTNIMIKLPRKVRRLS